MIYRHDPLDQGIDALTGLARGFAGKWGAATAVSQLPHNKGKNAQSHAEKPNTGILCLQPK